MLNSAQSRFYLLNQVICGADVASIPQEIRDACGVQNLESRLKALSLLPEPAVSQLTRVLISFLRVPEYTIAQSKNGNIITAEVLISQLRAGGLPVEACIPWVISMFDGLKVVADTPPRIVDGALMISEETNAKEDINDCIAKALQLVAYGNLNGDTRAVELIHLLSSMYSTKADFKFSANDLESIIAGMEKFGINPAIYGKYCVSVGDLSYTFKIAGLPCWWTTYAHKSVSCVVPTTRKENLTRVVMEPDDFFNMCIAGAASRLYVKGKTIAIAEGC